MDTCMSHDLFTWPEMTWGVKKGEKCDHLVVAHTSSSHNSFSLSLGVTSHLKSCLSASVLQLI